MRVRKLDTLTYSAISSDNRRHVKKEVPVISSSDSEVSTYMNQTYENLLI
jgi:hypothetical protein